MNVARWVTAKVLEATSSELELSTRS